MTDILTAIPKDLLELPFQEAHFTQVRIEWDLTQHTTALVRRR
jgi:hypothetical protein